MEISFKGNIEEYKEFLNLEIKRLSSKLENSSTEHKYVDLGLPSGTLWATCNIGANRPEEYGDYFAWGETKPKDYYNWDTYKYCSNGSWKGMTKYTYPDNLWYDDGTFIGDNNITLDADDDAATVNWGGNWRMPTHKEQKELVYNCYWVYTSSYNGSGIAGYIVYKAKSDSDKGQWITDDDVASSDYSLSDAHIFLPCAGNYYDNLINSEGSGYYWSSSVGGSYCYFAQNLNFISSYINYEDDSFRCHGFLVRAVYNKK